MEDLNLIPDPKSMFVDNALYERFKLTLESLPEFMEIIDFNEPIDCYCLKCKKESTFQPVDLTSDKLGLKVFEPHILDGLRQTVGKIAEVKKNKPLGDISSDFRRHLNVPLDKLKDSSNYVYKHFLCTRNKEHMISFTFLLDNYVFSKVGQYPSVADFNRTYIKRYSKVLKKDKYDEFNKAISLASHGIGIGSFVYFRRIFESLIDEAYLIQKNSSNWDDEIYLNSRMDNRIKLLESVLPEFLVKNRHIYGILSAGIHELSEDQCLKIFPDVKLGIELILDEKLHQIEREKKIRSATAKLSNIHESMKSKKL